MENKGIEYEVEKCQKPLVTDQWHVAERNNAQWFLSMLRNILPSKTWVVDFVHWLKTSGIFLTYKIKIENVTVLPNGDFFADIHIDRKEGNGFFLKDLKIEYNSFKEFFDCINNNLFEEYNISFINEVAERYFNKAYKYCKEIVKPI